MDNDLLAEKSYSSVMKYIRIAGSKDEVHQIRSVLRMISSAPMGREILKEIADEKVYEAYTEALIWFRDLFYNDEA